MNTSSFQLDLQKGYFKNQGVNVMAFDDIYPEGHQSGVSLLMHGHRLATNGDIRFEPTPGQWQPVPKQLSRHMDEKANTITTTLCYPDLEKHLNGKYTNPMLYPDFEFQYTVTVQGEEKGVHITVDMDRPVSPEFAGKLCFNLELFPGSLFDQPWIMDDQSGIFPHQPNGPTMSQPSLFEKSGHIESDNIRTTKERLAGPLDEYSPLIADDLIAEPYAVGRHFTVCPQDPLSRFTVESKGTELRFFDGRMNHNNGWFVLSAVIPSEQTEKVVDWWIYPNVVDGWQYEPVVQTSQVGYHPAQPKIAFIELDSANADALLVQVVRLGAQGPEKVAEIQPDTWGKFLRYRYLKADFTAIREPGLYQICYGNSISSIFRIAEDVYDRGVWQPVLEYFLPVQMCHMRVNEKYRVWHDLCHNDDAVMASTNFHHFDGYSQGPSTLTKYKISPQVLCEVH